MHLAAFFILALCAIAASRLIRFPPSGAEELKEFQRIEDLLPRLLPYAYHGDRARLLAVIGGVSGLRAMRRSSSTISTLIARRARAAGCASRIAEQTFLYSVAARWVILGAIVETWLCRLVPLWPPICLTAAAQIYCEMAVTYEALVDYI